VLVSPERQDLERIVQLDALELGCCERVAFVAMSEEVAKRRAAASMGLCPVCQRGPVRVTRKGDDGSQEGVCEKPEKHEVPLFLERDSESEPWRVAEPDTQ
jgi:hypothetical protein